MDRRILEAIAAGRKGISLIINNEQVIRLIDQYPLDEEAMKRIEGIDFNDYRPYICDKDGGESSMFPAVYFGRRLRCMDDYSKKLFVMLYCFTASAHEFDERINKYLDIGTSTYLEELGYSSEFFDIRTIDHYEQNIEMVKSSLIDEIVDEERIIHNFIEAAPNINNYHAGYEKPRQGLSEFCLSAGYHYLNDNIVVPDSINNRFPGYSVLYYVATSMYVSIMTGEDFYDVLRNSLVANKEDALGDVFAMVRKNIELEKLRSEKKNIEAKLAKNVEETRKQETAGEIIAESFGKDLSYEEIDSRIKKCIGDEHWEILCWLESITGKRFSFLDKLNLAYVSNLYYNEILKKNGVILSNKELIIIKTVENLADTIIRHRHEIYGELYEDDAYDLETRIKETEERFNIEVDRNNIDNINKLRTLMQEYYYSIDGRIKEMIVNHLEVDPSEVTPSANLRNDLGADSLDFYEIPIKAEQEFGLKISDEEAHDINTVWDLYLIISSKIKEKGLK